MKIIHGIPHAPLGLVLATTVIALSATPAFAQPALPSTPLPSMQPPQVAPSDRAFVTEMLQEARGQVALAELAQRRAGGALASSAASQTAAEWEMLRARLLPIAYGQGAPVRGTLDDAQRTVLYDLGRTPAARFDAAYVRDAERGDQAALARMEREDGTSDAAIQRFLNYAQPIVSSDEQMTSDDTSDLRAPA